MLIRSNDLSVNCPCMSIQVLRGLIRLSGLGLTTYLFNANFWLSGLASLLM